MCLDAGSMLAPLMAEHLRPRRVYLLI